MCELGFFAEAYVAEKGAVVEHHRPLRLHLSRGSRICLCVHHVLCVSWPCVFLLPSLGYRLVKSEIAPELTRRKGGPKPVPFKLRRLVDHQYREFGKGDGDGPAAAKSLTDAAVRRTGAIRREGGILQRR